MSVAILDVSYLKKSDETWTKKLLAQVPSDTLDSKAAAISLTSPSFDRTHLDVTALP